MANIGGQMVTNENYRTPFRLFPDIGAGDTLALSRTYYRIAHVDNVGNRVALYAENAYRNSAFYPNTTDQDCNVYSTIGSVRTNLLADFNNIQTALPNINNYIPPANDTSDNLVATDRMWLPSRPEVLATNGTWGMTATRNSYNPFGFGSSAWHRSPSSTSDASFVSSDGMTSWGTVTFSYAVRPALYLDVNALSLYVVTADPSNPPNFAVVPEIGSLSPVMENGNYSFKVYESTPCNSHTDTDGDHKCDACDFEMNVHTAFETSISSNANCTICTAARNLTLLSNFTVSGAFNSGGVTLSRPQYGGSAVGSFTIITTSGTDGTFFNGDALLTTTHFPSNGNSVNFRYEATVFIGGIEYKVTRFIRATRSGQAITTPLTAPPLGSGIVASSVVRITAQSPGQVYTALADLTGYTVTANGAILTPVSNVFIISNIVANQVILISGSIVPKFEVTVTNNGPYDDCTVTYNGITDKTIIFEV